MTNPARSVIERHCLNLTMSAEKIPALIKRHRMRKHPPYIAQLHSRRRDQIVSNAQMHLAVDKKVTRQEQVEMLGNSAGERILDGNDCRLHAAVLHAIEYFRRAGARNHSGPRQHGQSGFMAEGTQLALDGYFHRMGMRITEPDL